MARMQKKKPAEQKKKKKGAGDSVSGGADDKQAAAAGGSGKGSGVTSAASEKSKPARSGSASRAGGQSAVLRLLDRYFGNWIQFLREVKVELGRVTWPTRKETVGTTAVVLVFVFIIAIFLGVVDMGLSSLVRLIL
ncbi:MAG: preprotein translocase subunit SecE [Desulfobacteraceae bacterium]|nr:preprotein translocase subunit SecE [Desulfobacteraceae bacterium]